MSEIKIIDKRMFTAEGELRDGYEESDDAADQVEESPRPEPAPRPAAAPRETVDLAAGGGPASAPIGGGAPKVELPPESSAYGSPGILDLVAMLAEPIAIYLGDAPMPGGESAENLDLARLHIDLLEVVRDKTSGNLTAQEYAILDDLLYRLRMRYVEKRG